MSEPRSFYGIQLTVQYSASTPANRASITRAIAIQVLHIAKGKVAVAVSQDSPRNVPKDHHQEKFIFLLSSDSVLIDGLAVDRRPS